MSTDAEPVDAIYQTATRRAVTRALTRGALSRLTIATADMIAMRSADMAALAVAATGVEVRDLRAAQRADYLRYFAAWQALNVVDPSARGRRSVPPTRAALGVRSTRGAPSSERGNLVDRVLGDGTGVDALHQATPAAATAETLRRFRVDGRGWPVRVWALLASIGRRIALPDVILDSPGSSGEVRRRRATDGSDALEVSAGGQVPSSSQITVDKSGARDLARTAPGSGGLWLREIDHETPPVVRQVAAVGS